MTTPTKKADSRDLPRPATYSRTHCRKGHDLAVVGITSRGECRACKRERDRERSREYRERVRLAASRFCKQCSGPLGTGRKFCSAACYNSARRARSREHYEQNRERSREYARQMRKSNPERYRERQRKWRARHREQERERGRKRYEQNREQERERSRKSARKWRKDHPGRNREIQREYFGGARSVAVEALGGKCARCGATDELNIHHPNRDGAEHRAIFNGKGSAAAYHRSIAAGDLRDFTVELLCKRCHAAEHSAENAERLAEVKRRASRGES